MQEGKRRTPEEMREDYRRSYTNLKAAIADSIEHLENLRESYNQVQQMLEKQQKTTKE